MKRTHVLLIEENRILREEISAMLRNENDISVGIVQNGGLIPLTAPHAVILLSIVESSRLCLQNIRQIKTDLPLSKVVIINVVPHQNDIIDFVENGVHGFIMKDATGSVFTETIRSVDAGRYVLPPCLTAHLFAKITDQTVRATQPSVPLSTVHVSKREQEIMSLITEGLSNNEIALALNLSVFTVKSHVHNILNKLAMNTRIQISKYSHSSSSSS